jgi:DNA-directed RNA polymerase specialized sigma24 family protein
MLGFSVADASEILGVSADTLLSRCDRGRARLVAELARWSSDSTTSSTEPRYG